MEPGKPFKPHIAAPDFIAFTGASKHRLKLDDYSGNLFRVIVRH